MNALGGIPGDHRSDGHCAAKTVALAALRLLEDKAARDAAMDEFVTRTGGGIGGSNWIAPLCDYDPPIHFRWPEYVTTRARTRLVDSDAAGNLNDQITDEENPHDRS